MVHKRMYVSKLYACTCICTCICTYTLKRGTVGSWESMAQAGYEAEARDWLWHTQKRHICKWARHIRNRALRVRNRALLRSWLRYTKGPYLARIIVLIQICKFKDNPVNHIQWVLFNLLNQDPVSSQNLACIVPKQLVFTVRQNCTFAQFGLAFSVKESASKRQT